MRTKPDAWENEREGGADELVGLATPTAEDTVAHDC
jgi:hypothetical protein